MASLAEARIKSFATPRWLFTAVIFLGSFLLFLVQPMLARMALPKLGGAPAVWNSAMLVYQALLLAGYAYAHLLGRLSSRSQVSIHLAVLFAAAVTLPLSLYPADPPADSDPVLWVPWLLLLSVGPLFFAVAAQAPLLQRWFAMSGGGNPYSLYVASNLGSFCGLLAFPLLLEPNIGVSTQSWWWSLGFAVLVSLVAISTAPLLRRNQSAPSAAVAIRIGWKRLAKWALIAAVPSGLMLSTTLHLSTDIAPMPLMWVIPLGLYLLSFSVAFNENGKVARICCALAPFSVAIAASLLFVDLGQFALLAIAAAIVTMFLVSVALHKQLFDDRPAPEQLTLFYLALSVGGVLGGLCCALIAPLIFDWTYEHPLLLLAAAWLLGGYQPLPTVRQLTSQKSVARVMWAIAAVLAIILVLLSDPAMWAWRPLLVATTAIVANFCLGRRALFTFLVAVSLLAGGVLERLGESFSPGRITRSYFGVYRIMDSPGARALVHGTTTHGVQLTGSEARERTPTSYYWTGSGVGRVMSTLPALTGGNAKVGVVGLGTGTLACYARPGESWSIYEIDPTVVAIAQSSSFSFLRRCLPQVRFVIGDARLRLAEEQVGKLDVLVVDAFSSDAIPVHLLTTEAFAVYRRVLRPGGLLLIHISNRFLDLRPVVRTSGESVGMAGMMATAPGEPLVRGFGSKWTVLSNDRRQLATIRANDPDLWVPLPYGRRVRWTDDHASILPVLQPNS